MAFQYQQDRKDLEERQAQEDGKKGWKSIRDMSKDESRDEGRDDKWDGG